MRKLTEKETKQKESIEKLFAENGLKNGGKYKIVKPFAVELNKQNYTINSLIIGHVPFGSKDGQQREGYTAYINLFSDEKAIGVSTFAPDDIEGANLQNINMKNFKFNDFKLSELPKFIEKCGSLEIDKAYYERAIKNAEDVISECKKFIA